MIIDRVVNNDLLMHGTREHADALRAQPEVRKVVPLLPELKVTPHFDALLPAAPANGTVSLNVRLTAYERHQHLRPVGAELAGRLTRALRERCAAAWRSRPSCNLPAGKAMAVEAHSERLAVVVPVALQDALAVAEALAHEPEVMWVEPHQEFRAFNVDGVQASQSGSAGFPGGRPATVGTTPIWDMGLHGEGEIIGVGDSGLDTGHCFFEQAQGGEPTDQTYGPTHRKVVAYRAYADGGAEGERDHGTHVVGSILGDPSAPGAEGAAERGSAWAAKVSFTDIGPGDAPGLQVPNDLANNFFNIDYDNGARIHSNSWGANVNAYTTSTVGVDQASYDRDDLVILFAAGNSGNPDLTPSIGAPATCKNCITVGATENDNGGRPVGVSTAHRSAPSAPSAPSPSPSPAPAPSRLPQLTSPTPSPSPPAPGRRIGGLLVDRLGRGRSHQARRDRARLLHLLGQLERGGRLPHHRDGRHLHGHAHHRRQRGADPPVPSRGLLARGRAWQRPRRQQLRRQHHPIGRSDEGDDDIGGPGDARCLPSASGWSRTGPRRLPQPVLGLRPCAAQPGAVCQGKRQDRGRQAVPHRRRDRGHRRREGLHHPNARRR